MPFKPTPDYWIRIPGGVYRLGLTQEEAHALALQSARWKSGKGAEFSLNDRKMIERVVALGATAGDPAWLERYLLAHYPAHEVTLAEFSIARRPVSNREFRQFMSDTGETQRPTAWDRNGSANQADDLPAQGVGWWQAMAFVEWANARIAFESEWERAMRGPNHQLFPWGNELLPVGQTIIERGYLQALPASTTTTSEGIEGGVRGSPEWSAGLWRDKTSATEWGEEPAPSWSRMTLGGGADDKVIPSALSRSPGYFGGYGFGSDVASLRLVKADGRAIAKPSAATPREKLAMEDLRRFESRVTPQVMKLLSRSPMVRDHSISSRPVTACRITIRSRLRSASTTSRTCARRPVAMRLPRRKRLEHRRTRSATKSRSRTARISTRRPTKRRTSFNKKPVSSSRAVSMAARAIRTSSMPTRSPIRSYAANRIRCTSSVLA